MINSNNNWAKCVFEVVFFFSKSSTCHSMHMS